MESLKDDLLCLKKNHEEVRKVVKLLNECRSDKVRLIDFMLFINLTWTDTAKAGMRLLEALLQDFCSLRAHGSWSHRFEE